MSRGRLLVVGLRLSVTLALVGVGAWMVWPRPSAITWDNAAKIKAGMTLREVEAILGGRARDDTTGLIINRDFVIELAGAVQREWRSDTVIAIVCFDAR